MEVEPRSQRIAAWNQSVGLVLIGVAGAILLALVSYSPRDLPSWVPFSFIEPPSARPDNLLGRTGAVIAGTLFFVFGAASFLLGALILGVGAAKLIAPQSRLVLKLPWLAAFVVVGTCLAQLQPWFFRTLQEDFNLDGAGGWIGHVVGEKLIAGHIGVFTSLWLLSILYIAILVLMLGIRVSTLPADLKGLFDQISEARRRRQFERAAPLERLDLQKQQLEEQRRRILKEAERSGVDLSSIDESEPDIPTIEQDQDPKVQPQKSNRAAASAREARAYALPSIGLLEKPETIDHHLIDPEEVETTRAILIQTLAQFGIQVQPGPVTRGPTITRYEVYPPTGVRVDRIVSLERDIARATRAERLNILAPVPGKDTVGIEIANSRKVAVRLRELIESSAWKNGDFAIPLALGKDVYGNAIMADLARMPHLLVAGTTGSGKSVCINSILVSMLLRFTPEQIRLLLIDPKVVELQLFNELPHLLAPVITDPKKVVPALNYIIDEMQQRYALFSLTGVKNIAGFNRRDPSAPLRKARAKSMAPVAGAADQLDLGLGEPASNVEDSNPPIPARLPYIVVIIDELADLMQTAPVEVEGAIARITQMARAAGIHVIVATQTPRVDVVTGLIKANIPCRIAFQVASKIDSRVILDQNGADRLLGQGDMLYLPPGTSKLVRAQGAFLSDEEVQRIVDHICAQRGPNYVNDMDVRLNRDNADGENEITAEDRELTLRCWDVILAEGKASTSMLQRKLRLGYTRAARIMDILELEGCIGPADGAKPREVYPHAHPFGL